MTEITYKDKAELFMLQEPTSEENFLFSNTSHKKFDEVQRILELEKRVELLESRINNGVRVRVTPTGTFYDDLRVCGAGEANATLLLDKQGGE